MLFLSEDKKYFSSTLFPSSLSAGFGTKLVGDGRDKTKLSHYLDEQKIRYNRVIHPSQYHSSSIEVVDSSKEQLYRCDGLITREKGIVLTVITADCSPIIYFDPVQKISGISHQGWKGTLDKLPSKMIKKMKDLGAQTEHIHCVMGPSINDCCYEIYGERFALFQEKFQEDIFRKDEKNMFINIAKANHASLTESGIDSKHIDHFPFCTSCKKDSFWSYHRDGKLIGEMISWVMQG